MAFNTYGAEQSEKRESNVDYDALNKYVVDTVQAEQPETMVGVVSMIVDLGTQKLPDAEYEVDDEDKGLTVDELNEKHKEAIESGKITKYDMAYDNGKQVIKKFVPQKDRQAIVYAVDFPDVILDKGYFFGQSNPQPLRLFIGGQFWDGEKMLVQNMIALKVKKDDNIEGGNAWTMNPKSSLYKMALGAKLIETGKAFNPSRIDELLGKSLQFEIQVFMKPSKNGKSYYTEKLKYVGGLGRGQQPLTLDKTYMIEFNGDNDVEGLKQLRTHVVNTIKNATNYQGSKIQQQLENLNSGNNTSNDNKQDNSTPPKYDDSDIPFGDAKAEDVGDEW